MGIGADSLGTPGITDGNMAWGCGILELGNQGLPMEELRGIEAG